jgi:hypothetical protein
MKNVQFTVVALAIFCLVGIAMTRESVPPNGGGPILARPCYALFPTFACEMCHERLSAGTCGTPPNDCECDYEEITNQLGYTVQWVETGGNHGPIRGDGTAILCHFIERICTNGICALTGRIVHTYGINTAAEGTECSFGMESQ